MIPNIKQTLTPAGHPTGHPLDLHNVENAQPLPKRPKLTSALIDSVWLIARVWLIICVAAWPPRHWACQRCTLQVNLSGSLISRARTATMAASALGTEALNGEVWLPWWVSASARSCRRSEVSWTHAIALMKIAREASVFLVGRKSCDVLQRRDCPSST
jgi:hypothetical protein